MVFACTASAEMLLVLWGFFGCSCLLIVRSACGRTLLKMRTHLKLQHTPCQSWLAVFRLWLV